MINFVKQLRVSWFETIYFCICISRCHENHMKCTVNRSTEFSEISKIGRIHTTDIAIIVLLLFNWFSNWHIRECTATGEYWNETNIRLLNIIILINYSVFDSSHTAIGRIMHIFEKFPRSISLTSMLLLSFLNKFHQRLVSLFEK